MTDTPLTITEARMLTAKAVTTANALAYLLKELYDRQAWKVLGYPSFKAYIEDNFEPSLSTIYRMIKRETVREALAGHVILTRFTGGALEALLDDDIDHMRQVADIAARSVSGDIGKDAIKHVQAAITETMTTGAVDIGGEQYTVSDALADSVRGTLREDVLKKREYIVANIEAIVIDVFNSIIELEVDVIGQHFTSGDKVRISIWRE